jgi:predicted site-specific integrase-resolvase
MHRKARPQGKFIALGDAANEYGIPYATLYRWIDRGLIARLSETSWAAPSASDALTSMRSSART